MNPQKLRREVIDTLTRELEISPNKWTQLMTKLSQICEFSDSKQALSYLLDHCSRLLKANSVNETKAVEEFSVKDTKRITQSFHEASEAKLLAAAAITTTETTATTETTTTPRKLSSFHSLFTDTLRIISEVEFKPILSNAISKLPYVKNKSTVVADNVELELQAPNLIRNIFEFVDYIIKEGELMDLLVLLKVLFTLLESSSEQKSIPREETLSNMVLLKLRNTTLDSNYSDLLLKLEKCGLIGKKDLIGMINLMTEKDRLQTFDCYPRLLIHSGQPGKLRSLEVQGFAAGFLGGVFVNANSGCSYFEVTLKGCTVGTLGVRMGWGICGTHLSDYDSKERKYETTGNESLSRILLPGDTADAWTFDGSCGGHLYHNATFIGNMRREECIVSNILNENQNKEDVMANCGNESVLLGTGADALLSVSTAGVAVSEPTVTTGEDQKQELSFSDPSESVDENCSTVSEGMITTEGDKTEIPESKSGVENIIYSATSSTEAANAVDGVTNTTAAHPGGSPSKTDSKSIILNSVNSVQSEDVKASQPFMSLSSSISQLLSLSSSSSSIKMESNTVIEESKEIPPSTSAPSSRSILSREDHFKAFMRMIKVGLDIEVIHSLMTQEGLSEEDIDNFIAQEKRKESFGSAEPSLQSDSNKQIKKVSLEKYRNEALIKASKNIHVARELAFAAGGILLGNQEDGIVVAVSDEEPYPPYPIPSESKNEDNLVSSKDGVVWSTGTVVGCLLNTNTGEMSYYVDGKKIGSGSQIDISMKEKLSQGKSFCPVFSCNSTAGLEFNIGQLPFLHEPVLRSSVQESVVFCPIISLSDLFEKRSELGIFDKEGNDEDIMSSSQSTVVVAADVEKEIDQHEEEQTLIHPVLSFRKSPYLRLGYLPSPSPTTDEFKSSESNRCCNKILINGSKASISGGFTIEMTTRMLQEPLDESYDFQSMKHLGHNRILFSFALLTSDTDNKVVCSLFVNIEGALSFMIKRNDGVDFTMRVNLYTTISHVILPLVWNHISLVVTNNKLNKKQKNTDNILIHSNGIPVGSFMSSALSAFLSANFFTLGDVVIGDFDTATDNAHKSDTTKFENSDEPQANENVDKDEKRRNDLDAVSTSISDGSVVVKKSDFLHWIGDICEFRQWNSARVTDDIASSLGRTKISGVEPGLLVCLAFEEGFGYSLYHSAILNDILRDSNSIVLIGHQQLQETSLWGFQMVDKSVTAELNLKARAEIESKLGQPLVRRASVGKDSIYSMESIYGGKINESFSCFTGFVEEVSVLLDQQRPILNALISTIIKKLLKTADNYIEADSGDTRAPSATRKFQSSFFVDEISLVASPKTLNFMLLESILKQTRRLNGPPERLTYEMESVLLKVLKANLLRSFEKGLSPDDMGLCYRAIIDSSHKQGEISQTLVFQLLSTLLVFISGEKYENSLGNKDIQSEQQIETEVLRAEAISIFILGLNIFIPSKMDQLILLESLINKKTCYLTQNVDDIGNENIPLKEASDSDVSLIHIIIDLSKEGVDALLLALLNRFNKPDAAWDFIPKPLQQCGLHPPLPSNSILNVAGDISLNVFPDNTRADTQSNTDIFVGDVVERGPDWNYGNQDTCVNLECDAIKESSRVFATGFVVKISPWLNCLIADLNVEENATYEGKKRLIAIEEEKEKEQREGLCVSVQWSHGGVNTYRWGVPIIQSFSHSPADICSYDLKVIQYDSETKVDKKILKYSPGQVFDLLPTNIGDISSSAVLEYLKNEASNAWLKENLPQESVLSEFQIVLLYQKYHSAHGVLFTPKNEVFLFEDIVGGSALLNVDAKVISKSVSFNRIQLSLTKFIEESYSGTGILKNHIKDGDISSVQTLSNMITEAAISLLSSFQCLMIGQGEISQENLPKLSVDTCEKGHRLMSDPFVGIGNAPMTWNWKNGSWNTVPKGADDKAIDPGSNVKTTEIVVKNLLFDPSFVPDSIILSDSHETVHQCRNRRWGTAVGTIALHPNTGIYKWYVLLDNQSGKRGHCMIGVATADVNVDYFLGQDSESWGLTTNKDLFQDGKKIRSDYGHKLSRTGTVEVILDTDKGTLSFTDLETSHGSYGVAFSNLKGISLRPAFSLYSADDSITLLAGFDESHRANSSSAKKSYKSSLVSAASLLNGDPKGDRPSEIKAPKGVPSPFLIQLLLQYITSAGNILEKNVKAVMHPILSTNLLQLLSALSRWEHISAYESKEVFTALHLLLQKLRSAVITARQMSLSSLPTRNGDVEDEGKVEEAIQKEYKDGDDNKNKDTGAPAAIDPMSHSLALQAQMVRTEKRNSTTPCKNDKKNINEESSPSRAESAEELLVQLSCAVAFYISKLTSDWIKGDAQVDNYTLAMHLQLDKGSHSLTAKDGTMLPFLESLQSSEYLRRQSSRGWLKSALFAQGLKKSSDKLSNLILDLTTSPSEVGTGSRAEGLGVEAKAGSGLNTPADLLVRWLCLHDSTHQNLKRMGGEMMIQPVRALFAAHLHHGGFLKAAQAVSSRLAELYKVANSSTNSGGDNVESNHVKDSNSNGNLFATPSLSMYDLVIQTKPPYFLISSWEYAMKLRMAARTLIEASSTNARKEIENKNDIDSQNKGSTVLTIEKLANIMTNRIAFLLDIESCSTDHVADYIGSADLLLMWINGVNRDVNHLQQNGLQELQSVMSSNFLFVTDSRTSVPHIRAALDAVHYNALCRRNGLKALRSSLDQVTEDLGWGAKCAILLHFPKAIRINLNHVAKASPSYPNPATSSFNSPAAIKSSNRLSLINSNGHYSSGLEGCSRGERMELRGAFDSLYAHLVEELSSSSAGWDIALQLSVIDCLGVGITEDDHTMLSRVNIFYALEELIESAFAFNPDDSGIVCKQKLPSTASSTSLAAPCDNKSVQLVTQASMKLFILLALQVATSGEREMSYISSKSVRSSPLKRAFSGPGTLSKSVFDILYTQLSNISSAICKSYAAITRKGDNSNKNDNANSNILELETIEVTHEAGVVLTEALTLLYTVSQEPACQRLLVRSKWFALLIDLAIICPTECRQKALMLLSDLLPLADLEEFESSGFELGPCLSTHLGYIVESGDVVVSLIKVLLNIAAEALIDEDDSGVLIRIQSQSGSNESDPSNIFSRRGLPEASEAVSLLRYLLKSELWRDAVERELISVLTRVRIMSFKDEKDALLLKEAIAVLSILGGHVDSPYPQCPVIFESNETDTASFSTAIPPGSRFQSGSVSKLLANDMLEILTTCSEILPGSSEGGRGRGSVLVNVPWDKVRATNRCPLEDVVLSNEVLTALVNVVYYTVLHPLIDDQKDKVNQAIRDKMREGKTCGDKIPHYGYVNGEIFCDMNDYLDENGEYEDGGSNLCAEENFEDIKMEQKVVDIGDRISNEPSDGLNSKLASVMSPEDGGVDHDKKDLSSRNEKIDEEKRRKADKNSAESTKKMMRFLSHTATRAFASLSSSTSAADSIQYLLTRYIRNDIQSSETSVIVDCNIPRDFLYHLLDKAAVTTKSAGISDIAAVEESLVMKLIERRNINYQLKLKKNSIMNNLNLTKANIIQVTKRDENKDLTLSKSSLIQPSVLLDDAIPRNSPFGGDAGNKIPNIDSTSLFAVNDTAHDVIPRITNSIDSVQTETPTDGTSLLPSTTLNTLPDNTLGLVQRDTEDTGRPSTSRSPGQADSPARRALLLLAQEQAQLAQEIAQEDREMEQDREQSEEYSVALQGMGFPARWCVMALDCCGGDFDEALNYILSNGEALEQMTFNSDIQRANATSAEIEGLNDASISLGGSEPTVRTFSGAEDRDTGDVDLLEDNPLVEGLGSYEMIADLRSESESLLIQSEGRRVYIPTGSSSSLMDIGNDSSDEDDEDRGLDDMTFTPSMDHQKEFHYTGTNGKLLPLYKEPTRSSERLGSLFPGDDVLAYGVAMNLDNSERGDVNHSDVSDYWLKLRLSDYEDDTEYSSAEVESDYYHDLFVWAPRYSQGLQMILPGSGDGEQRPLADPPGDCITLNATYVVTSINGAVVREGIETTSQEIMSLNTGDEVQAFEEGFNTEGTLRLHIYINRQGLGHGWISKLGGLVSRVSGDKGDSISGQIDAASISNQGSQLVGEKTAAESDYNLLEAMDDNMEQWGGSEGYRKEDRFFGTLQGGAYQRTRDLVSVCDTKSNPLQVRRARLTGSATYSTAQEYLHGMSLAALDERIDTNIYLSILLNCRKALVAILLRCMVRKDVESKDDPDSGKERRELPSVISALILPFIGSIPLPLNTSTAVVSVQGGTVVPNGDDIRGKFKELMSPISDDTGELKLLVPRDHDGGLGQHLLHSLDRDAQDRTVGSAKDIAQKLVLFIRLVTFRGDPFYVSRLEYLGVDDITAAGTQLKSLTIDMIIGPLLTAILISDKYDNIEDIKVQRFKNFITALKEELLHSVVVSVAGNIKVSTSVTGSSSGYSSLRELPWSDTNNENETDEECVKSVNVHHASWVSRILLNSLFVGSDNETTAHASITTTKKFIPMSIFRLWSYALRSSSMSFKHLAFNTLAEILAMVKQSILNLTVNDGDNRNFRSSLLEVLQDYITLLPVERLKAMAAKRIWHEMEDFPSFSRYIQALVHLLSEVDNAASLLEMAKKQEIEASLAVKVLNAENTVENQDRSALLTFQQLDSRNTFPSLLQPQDCQEEKEALRPAIDFNSSHSHIQLSPQKDIQGSWTVEFWLRREEPSASLTESFQNQPSPERAENSNENNASSVFLRAGKKMLRTVLGSRELGGFSGFEGLAAGIPATDQPQSSRSKLSRLLGSDFGPLGGLDEGLGGIGRSVCDSRWGGSEEGEGGSTEAVADLSEELRRFDENIRGRSNWTIVPPVNPTKGAFGFEPSNDLDDMGSTGMDVDDPHMFQAESISSQEKSVQHDQSPSSFLSAHPTDTGTRPSQAERDALLDRIADFEWAEEMADQALHEEQEAENMDSIEPNYLSETVPDYDNEPHVKGDFPPTLTLPPLVNSTPSLGTNGVSTHVEGLLTQGNTNSLLETASIEGKKSHSQSEEVKGINPSTISPLQERDERNKENMDINKEKKSLSPIYLLSSTAGHVKLQMGGRTFSDEELKDPLQEINPVHNQAYSLSIGQKGAADKAFDFVVPSGEWIHLALTCHTGVSTGSSSVVSLYANGELKDTQSMRFNLPIATVGCIKKGQSFYGLLGEMRVWSGVRSTIEIKRDMYMDVSGSRNLISHLRCVEGEGGRTFDPAGLLNVCRLSGCKWSKILAPVMKKVDIPLFMLNEPEEVEGLFGESTGSSAGVIELTGVFKRDGCTAAQGEMALDAAEVVCLAYRLKTSDSSDMLTKASSHGVDSSVDSVVAIEGYLDWCERGVRSRLQGYSYSTGEFRFTISGPKATILGPPDSMDWLQSLSFQGVIVEGRLIGSYALSAYVQTLPALKCGETRVDRFSVPDKVIYKESPYGAETLFVQELAKEAQYLVTIEILHYEPQASPIKHPESDEIDGDSSLNKENEGESKCEDGSLAEEKKEDTPHIKKEAVIAPPLPIATLPVHKANNMNETVEKFGMCEGEGSQWVEWLVNCSRSGSISVGAMTYDAANDPDASMYCNPDVWCYLVSGQVSSGFDLCDCEPTDEGEVIGCHIDTNHGTVTFYRNDEFLFQFNNLNDHPNVKSNRKVDRLDPSKRGVRPFVCLDTGGDSVSFLGSKCDEIEIIYPENLEDKGNLASLTGQLLNGNLDGLCESRYRGEEGYHVGYYRDGQKEGTHLWVVPTTAVSNPVESKALVPPAPMEDSLLDSSADGTSGDSVSPASKVPGLERIDEQSSLERTGMGEEVDVDKEGLHTKDGEDFDDTKEGEISDLPGLVPIVPPLVEVEKGESIQLEEEKMMVKECKVYHKDEFLRDITGTNIERNAVVIEWRKIQEEEKKRKAASGSIPAGGEKKKKKSKKAGLEKGRLKSSAESLKERKRSMSNIEQDCVTFRMRDEQGNELHFKVSMNIKLQKVFDVYASKKNLTMCALRFLFDGERISGDMSPEHLGLEDNDVIDAMCGILALSLPSLVIPKGGNICGPDPTALELLENLYSTSTAPMIIQIVYANGATVRSGVEIEGSPVVRMLQYGDVLECFQKQKTREGIPRYQIADGWVSGMLRGGNEDHVLLVLRELLPPRRSLQYEIIRDGGAKIRSLPCLDSNDAGVCPEGTIVTIAEKRFMNTGGEERARLRILEPVQYAGWITDKDHICRLIEDETSRALTALENADIEITAETLRRTQVRLHRTMLAAKMSKKVPRKLVPLSGALDLSRETFFLLMNSGSGTGAHRRSGLTISPDFTSVSYNSQGGGRSMAIGSRGFTRGVHYWEVSVDAASWGSVFIGVSPGESSSWNGYGLLNYRATQAFGSETLYGSYFAAGDTVGVLLDMDKGTISFFKDGEDFNLGKVVVINMGVAYHNLRRNNRSPCSVLYPCFGIKSSGDQLSLRGSRWVSSKGLGPAALLRHTLEAKHILANWRDYYSYLPANNISCNSDSNLPFPLSDTVSPSTCYTSPSSLSFSLIHSSKLTKRMYNAYLRWRAHDREKVKSRPGLDVAIDTRQEAITSAGGILAAPNGMCAGRKLHTRYGDGRIIGAKDTQIWFTLESGETGAWYWNRNQLQDLVASGEVSFDNPDKSPPIDPPVLAQSQEGIPSNILQDDTLGAEIANPTAVALAEPSATALPPLPLLELDTLPSVPLPESIASPVLLVPQPPMAPLTLDLSTLPAQLSTPPTTINSDIEAEILSYEEFTTALYPLRSWTLLEDECIAILVNGISDKLGKDPLRIPFDVLERTRVVDGILLHRSDNELQARYAALCVLNKAASIALPLVDFGKKDQREPIITTDIKRFQPYPYNPFTTLRTPPMATGVVTSELGISNTKADVKNIRKTNDKKDKHYRQETRTNSSGQVFTDIKKAVFTRTKMTGLWIPALRESTTATGAPPDEYERPDDLKEISINRLEARNAESLIDGSSLDRFSFENKLKMSVFGQLIEGIKQWDDRSLRRSFTHMQDAGQARAFFVKFTGEGVDDHGGPYRAAFHTALGEEPAGLLGLLSPSMNSKTGTGAHRDQTVLNPEILVNADKLILYKYLGKLIAIACRHHIMVPLSLSELVWKPLVGESVDLEDLKGTDVHTVRSLREISEGDMLYDQAEELLVQALLGSSFLRLNSAVLTMHSSAATLAIKDFISQSTNSENNVEESQVGVLPSKDERCNQYKESEISCGTDGSKDAMSSQSRIRGICDLIFQDHLTRHQEGLGQLYKGMSAVLPTELFAMFTASELQTIFCGQPEVDLDVLQRATVYEGGVSYTDRHIKLFWQALDQMSQEERSKLINFCSGRSRLPASVDEFPMSFKLTAPPPRSKTSPDDYLPIAQTCFFSLSLPEYTSLQICKQKLKYAINNTELMDADFAMRNGQDGNVQGWENVR